jgi:hypothetical protein
MLLKPEVLLQEERNEKWGQIPRRVPNRISEVVSACLSTSVIIRLNSSKCEKYDSLIQKPLLTTSQKVSHYLNACYSSDHTVMALCDFRETQDLCGDVLPLLFETAEEYKLVGA